MSAPSPAPVSAEREKGTSMRPHEDLEEAEAVVAEPGVVEDAPGLGDDRRVELGVDLEGDAVEEPALEAEARAAEAEAGRGRPGRPPPGWSRRRRRACPAPA